MLLYWAILDSIIPHFYRNPKAPSQKAFPIHKRTLSPPSDPESLASCHAKTDQTTPLPEITNYIVKTCLCSPKFCIPTISWDPKRYDTLRPLLRRRELSTGRGRESSTLRKELEIVGCIYRSNASLLFKALSLRIYAQIFTFIHEWEESALNNNW